MSDYGIKVGSNIDLDTNKLLKDTSKYSSLKLYKWGDTSFTTNGSGVGSVEITHNLGYAPIVVAFEKFTASWSSPDNVLSGASHTDSFGYIGAVNFYNGYKSLDKEVGVDTTKVYISDNGVGLLAPSTTYYFRYYILVDKSQSFSGVSNVEQTGDYGIKVSKDGVDVTTAQEYEMANSSKYKSLQFYSNHKLSSSLTLPSMFASAYDTYVEEGTYVDFNHNLGYQPFFLVYWKLSTASAWTMFPFYLENGIDTVNYSVGGFCTSTFVRVYWFRASQFFGGTLLDSYTEQTINIRVVIFTENLAGYSY